MKSILILGLLTIFNAPAFAEELQAPIYDDEHPPASKDIKGLTFTRKEGRGRRSYRIYQYTLLNGTLFTTNSEKTKKKIGKVPNYCQLNEQYPRGYRVLQVFGLAGPAVMNGLGSGLGSAAGRN